MNNLQALVDGLSAQWQKERAATQLTLGGMITALESMSPETSIGLGSPHSYRGYYSDLAFEREPNTAGELLAACRAAMGEVFEGYKGGDFVMGARTPVWVASYGCCGMKLIGIAPDGSLTEAEDA